jgi:lipoprotein-anchoring transpeptidase ErfK/SrfK
MWMLVVALGTLPFGGVGCALFGSHPKPAVVGEAPAPAQAQDPYLLLSLTQRRVYLIDEIAGGPHESFPVAIGRKQYPTPTGRFQVNEMVMNPDFARFDFANPTSPILGRIPPGPNNPLGLRWIAFAHAHGWTVGFHGTQNTKVLGMAVSHGCVRMRNADVVKMYERVKLGTTVVVEP